MAYHREPVSTPWSTPQEGRSSSTGSSSSSLSDLPIDALTIALFVLLFTLLYPTFKLGFVRRAIDKSLSSAQKVLVGLWVYLVCVGVAVWVGVTWPQSMHHTLKDFFVALGIAANVYLLEELKGAL